MKSTFISLSFLLVFLTACNSSPELIGFDNNAWKADYNACNNQRAGLWKILSTKKDQLKELDDDAIVALLGSPERNRQFPKGKKNYIYFLYPGSQCDSSAAQKEGKKLVIEFDAMGKTSMLRESYLDF